MRISRIKCVNTYRYIKVYLEIFYLHTENILLLRQLTSICLKSTIHIIKVYKLKRSATKQKQIIFITIIIVFMLFIEFAYQSIFTLYLFGYSFSSSNGFYVSIEKYFEILVCFTNFEFNFSICVNYSLIVFSYFIFILFNYLSRKCFFFLRNIINTSNKMN